MAVMYLYPGTLGVLPDGRVAVWTKSMTSLRAFAASLDEELLVGAAVDPVSEVPVGAEPVGDEPNLRIVGWAAGGERERLAELAPELSLVMTLLSVDRELLLDLGVPVSFIAENTLRMRLDQLRASGPSAVTLVRSAIGLVRRERKLRGMLRRSAGLECNGPGAYRTYARFAPHAVEFNDSRVTDADIAAAQAIVPGEGGELRVAFSGRWIAIKGIAYVLEVARLAHEGGVRARFAVIGGGELEPAIRAAAPPNLEVVGYLDFETQWKPWVRANVDLMLLPHVQGDPSGTYFEALGCGVPLLGFHNESLTPLVGEGVAWAVRRGDSSGLVDVIARLARDRPELVRARVRALDYMSVRTMERNDVRRSAFVEAVARGIR